MVTYELIDTTALEDCTLSVEAKETQVSREAQVLDGNTDPTELRFTTCERNYFKLDGSNVLTPKTDEATNLELGYWSHEISNANGEFDNPPAVTFDFTIPHSSVGFVLNFDRHDPPKKFRLDFYDVDDNFIVSRVIDNNTDETVTVADGVENYANIKIFFLKTNEPYRRIRFNQFEFGIIQRYRDQELIDLKITREMSLLENNIPSNELSFTIDNIDKKFNIVNPSGIYAYLQDKQLVKSKIGVYLPDGSIEWVDTGKYYLDEWVSDGIKATLVARDSLSFIDEEKTITINSVETKTATEWYNFIFSELDISNYNIDNSLDSISITTIITNKEAKQLLRDLAVACNSVIYVDRDETIQVKPIPFNTSENLTLDNMYKEPKIELDTRYNTVNVTVFNPTAGEDEEIVSVNNMVVGDTVKPYSIEGNIFIADNTRALAVAQYYLEKLNNRLLYTVDWRQDASIDINELVNVEDGFNEDKNMIITKQELEYKGYLKGSTEGRGVDYANI